MNFESTEGRLVITVTDPTEASLLIGGLFALADATPDVITRIDAGHFAGILEMHEAASFNATIGNASDGFEGVISNAHATGNHDISPREAIRRTLAPSRGLD